MFQLHREQLQLNGSAHILCSLIGYSFLTSFHHFRYFSCKFVIIMFLTVLHSQYLKEITHPPVRFNQHSSWFFGVNKQNGSLKVFIVLHSRSHLRAAAIKLFLTGLIEINPPCPSSYNLLYPIIALLYTQQYCHILHFMQIAA